MLKREYGAVALLLALIFLSFWNIRKVDTLTSDVSIALSKSQSAAETLDYKTARNYLEEGLLLWQEAESYTHIFIRHSEIDTTTDAFFELKELLYQEEHSACAAAYEKLHYHLNSIRAMEKPSLGSIL